MLPLSEYSSLLKALMTPYLEIVLTPNIKNVYVVSQNTAYDIQLTLNDLIPRVIFEQIFIASKSLKNTLLSVCYESNFIHIYIVSQNTAHVNQLKLNDLVPRVIFE